MDVKEVCGSDDNVKKYVYDFGNAVAESVLYKYPTYEERTVICCSTQSGCPVGCRFCGAGDFFVRNLTALEIVSQVDYLFSHNDIDPSKVQKLQIMFMSMGEPLLNLDALIPAMRYLNEHYPNAKLLISTSAPRNADWDSLMAVAREIDTIGLQFSVHESTDEARRKLVPFKGTMTLEEMALKGAEFAVLTGRKAYFNYCVHEGNNSPEDADRLLATFNPLPFNATISVICERDESVAAANERQRELAENFSGLMLERGYDVRVFNPAGQDDIGGGCGQLWFVQDWASRHPEHTKRSVGHNLPKVHTPGVLNNA